LSGGGQLLPPPRPDASGPADRHWPRRGADRRSPRRHPGGYHRGYVSGLHPHRRPAPGAFAGDGIVKLYRLSAVMRKETREILRDRVTLATAFLFPVLMLLMFGYAISLEVENVRLGVLDQDQTPASAELIDQFAATRYFDLARRFDSETQLRDSIQANEVKLVLPISPNFATEMRREDAPQVQLLIDGTYSATALIALNYGLSIVSRFQPAGTPDTAIRVQPRVWYNPSLRSVIYVVSGLYAVIIASFPPLLTTLAIVREKES